MPDVEPVELVSEVTDFAERLAQYTLEEIKLFDVFKDVFNKKYDSVFKEQKALLNFLSNEREIKEHNAKYLLGAKSYKRALWKHSDLTSIDVNSIMNGFIRPVEARALKESRVDAKIPKNLNWTSLGYVSPGK